MTRPVINIGVVGFGWMGQAHSRSYRRIAGLFPERSFDTRLVLCADNVAARRSSAVDDFGFEAAAEDWRAVVEHPEIDVVNVSAPNMLHEPIAIAAAKAGKHVFCEKPVGGTPEQTMRIAAAAREAGVITGVGYNYRWAPMVQHVRNLIADGRLGEITNYRGRFVSSYGADPMGLLSWRFLVDEGGYGVSSDILSHAVDLAHYLIGPIDTLVGRRHTFITERPLPTPGAGSHYARGAAGDPTGTVTNEDYGALFCTFANGALGTFESSRAMVGPESQMAFDIHGTLGAVSWNLETMNELRVFLVDDSGRAPRGYTTVYAGDRYPYHGHFVPGDANAIGYEDLKVIEGYEYLSSVTAGRQHNPGFEAAVDYVQVQAAWLASCESGQWERVSR
jgi:predicted dehydrogenase